MVAENELSIPQRIMVQSVSIALGIVLAVVCLVLLSKVFDAMFIRVDRGQPVALPVEGTPKSEEF